MRDIIRMRALGSAGWFATKYRSGNATYGSTLWARSPKHAATVAKARGMGETIESAPMRRPDFTRPSSLFYGNSPVLEVLHATAFLCSIAARADMAEGHSANEDTGLLHEVIHYYLTRKDKVYRSHGKRFYSHKGRRRLYDWLRRVEAATPGYVARLRARVVLP